MLIQNRKQNSHVLHSRVHALAIKGHHGVGCVADDDTRGAIVIRLALEADEWKVRVGLEGLY